MSELRLLGLLAHVRPVAWFANCPSCKRPSSLLIVSAYNGLMLDCLSGCAAAAILASVDLDPSDIYLSVLHESRHLGDVSTPYRVQVMHEWLIDEH